MNKSVLLLGSGFSYFWRRCAAFMLTFYISYLFFHFIVLNIQNYENVIVMLSYIFVGHLILDIVGLALLKTTTCAGFAVSIKFKRLQQHNNQRLNLLVRAIVSCIVFYMTIYGIFLSGWQLSAFAIGFLIALVLNLNFIRHRGKTMSALDRLTGCRPLLR